MKEKEINNDFVVRIYFLYFFFNFNCHSINFFFHFYFRYEGVPSNSSNKCIKIYKRLVRTVPVSPGLAKRKHHHKEENFHKEDHNSNNNTVSLRNISYQHWQSLAGEFFFSCFLLFCFCGFKQKKVEWKVRWKL